MRYYKIIDNGYIKAVGTGASGVEISEAEYSSLLSVINNKPQDTQTTWYRLREDLTWEAYPAPPVEEDDDTALPEDYENALGRLGVDI